MIFDTMELMGFVCLKMVGNEYDFSLDSRLVASEQ